LSDRYRLELLAISGSLRAASYNTWLLNAAREVAPEGVVVHLYVGLEDIPPYNDDVRANGFPQAVEKLRSEIRAAHALLFATPEYNRSFSGVIKNAIDWASRPPEQPFSDKPAIVMGAGPGVLGTALANYHLRQVLAILGVHVLPGFEFLVGRAAEKFDSAGKLIDAPTKEALAGQLRRLADYARGGASV